MDIVRSSTKVFVAKIASSGIGFLALTFFARELGPAPTGVFFLFQTLVGVAAVIVDFGVGTTPRSASAKKSVARTSWRQL